MVQFYSFLQFPAEQLSLCHASSCALLVPVCWIHWYDYLPPHNLHWWFFSVFSLCIFTWNYFVLLLKRFCFSLQDPLLSCWPSQLGLQNTLTASLQRVKTHHFHNECPRHDTKHWWWGSRNAGALGNTKYPFIAIASRSTLAQSGSTW